ncbi:MAG TPA: penicillin-binding protein activator, partial [Gammaproteobacteria bacterium]|nr:penicillin-binding protein activator [Gammaproteobacteria bacterium]
MGLLSLCLLYLAACTTQPVTSPSRPSSVQNLESRARVEVANGNFSTAADLYTQLAATVSGTLRSGYLIEAARLLIEGGDVTSARRRLSEVRADRDRGADHAQRQAVVVLLARIELEQGRPQPALDILSELQQPIAVPVLSDAAAVRGRALFRLGRHADAVRVLVEREVWLDDAAQVLGNQRMIWDGFREPSTPAAIAPTGDRIVDGWLALAPLARSAGGDADLRRALLAWRETYTDHPAAGRLLAELLSAQRSAGFPAQIALLLPLSSAQRTEALAIRDGFLAAHLRSSRGNGTSIR